MKKIIFLLLLITSVSYGQAIAPTRVKITNNAISTTAPFIATQETDGFVNKINKFDLIEVIEYASAVNLPVTGVAGKIYVTKDNGKIYRWNGTFYSELAYTDISGKANDADVVHKTGNLAEDITGLKTLVDGIKLGDNSGDDKTLLSLPSLTTLKFTKKQNNNFDFNIDGADPDSFFLTSEEGKGRQSLYFGDADNSFNYFGLSVSLDFGNTWKNSFAINANGYSGFNNNNPQYQIDVSGDIRSSGEINSNTGFSVSKIEYNTTYVSPDLPTKLSQGYTFDGKHHFILGTNNISKYDYNYNLILENNNPLNGISGVDHLGDGVYLNGFIYAPVEAYPAVTGMKIAKYSAETLNLIETYDISTQNHEVSSVTTDGSILFVSSYTDGTKIFKYSLTGVYLGYINISNPFTNNIQGITYWKNNLYVVEQTRLSKLSIDGTKNTFLRLLPSDLANTHRGEGLQMVNGELRINLFNSSNSAINIYYLNSVISTTKEFAVNKEGDVLASSFVKNSSPATNILLAGGTDVTQASLPISTATQTALNGKISGSGTINYIPKFTESGTVGNSSIFNGTDFTGFGTNTGVGTDYISIRFNSSTDRSQAINILDSNPSANASPFLVFRKNDQTYLGNIARSGTSDGIFIGGNEFLSLGYGSTENLRLSSIGSVFSSTVTATSFNGSATLTGTPTAPTAAPGTNTTQIATTAFVQANVRPYKVYTALLSQTGTSAPVATVLENTLGGTVVWTRTGVGAYVATLSNAFPIYKTFLLLAPSASGGQTNTLTSNSSSTVELGVSSNAGNFADGFLTSRSIEIRVYN